MAEWSKALRSGRSIFGCVGSNLTPVILLLNLVKRNKKISLFEIIAIKRCQIRIVVSQKFPITNGRMAEWSKALRLGRSIFGCEGSNPTPVIILLNLKKRNKLISLTELIAKEQCRMRTVVPKNTHKQRQDGRVV